MRKSIWKIEKLIAMVVMTATCIILLLSVVLCAPLWLLLSSWERKLVKS